MKTSRDTAEFLPSLVAPTPRRGVIASLTGGLLALLSSAFGHDGISAHKHHKQRRHKHRNTRHRRQGGNQPPSPPPPAAPPSPVVIADATCSGPDDGDTTAFDPTGRLAETFTAIATGPFVRAELLLRKLAIDTGDYVLRLSPVDGAGVPADEVLAATSVSNSAVPVGVSTVAFSFSNPITVTSGTTYALVLTKLDGTGATWRSNSNDACGGVGFTSITAADDFSAVTDGTDFIFTTFVSS